MNGSRRNRHEYLVMWIDYSVEVEVFISMEYYPKGVIDDFLKWWTGNSSPCVGISMT